MKQKIDRLNFKILKFKKIMKLEQIVPSVLLYLGKEGVSVTAANSKKVENANQVRLLMKTLDADVYQEETTMLTSTGIPSTSKKEVKILVVGNFSVLQTIAKFNAESALLGIGIKTFQAAMQEIQKIDALQLVENQPGFAYIEPKCVQTAVHTVDNVLAQESVEQIVGYLTTNTLNKLDANMIREGLQLEAACAVLGKQLAPEAFLRQLLEAKPALKPVDITTPFALITRTPVIAYSDEQIQEFKKFYDDLQADYKLAQSKLNGIKKQIKDAIRMIDSANKAEYKQKYDEYSALVAKETRRIQSLRNDGEKVRQSLMAQLLELKIKV
jgi:hypothetical protein